MKTKIVLSVLMLITFKLYSQNYEPLNYDGQSKASATLLTGHSYRININGQSTVTIAGSADNLIVNIDGQSKLLLNDFNVTNSLTIERVNGGSTIENINYSKTYKLNKIDATIIDNGDSRVTLDKLQSATGHFYNINGGCKVVVCIKDVIFYKIDGHSTLTVWCDPQVIGGSEINGNSIVDIKHNKCD